MRRVVPRAQEELQKWLRERFSGYETEALDVYEQFDALQVAGSEFGYMLPGVIEACERRSSWRRARKPRGGAAQSADQ